MQTRRGKRRILVRRRRWKAMYQVEKMTNNESNRKRKRKGNGQGRRRGRARRRREGGKQEYRDAETEGLIRECKKTAKPNQKTVGIL